ncbi:hypothetical protein ACIPLC_33980 [Kitasatospora sp. NPDC086801]|uniref:hypothetical protein n=1 Tax=Kitasatospora sp. NPDC086801 TaxID=3364066 RepID=UPI00381F86FA
MITSSLAFDVVDIDVDVDLAWDADTVADLPHPVRTSFEVNAPILMEPAPQITQMDFELEAPALLPPASPQLVQMDFDAAIA